MQSPPYVVVDHLARVYRKGASAVPVFTDLTFTIHDGEFVALLGPSGSGKSTILNLLAGFDRPTAGGIMIGGQRVEQMPERQLAEWRAVTIGFIFQSHNLVDILTAVENVEFPLRRIKMSAADRRARAERALGIVGLAHRKGHLPRELSGGEEQRVAIARAIVTDPKLIIADEPTGNLDADSARTIMEMLGLLVTEHRKTVLLVTHDQSAAAYAHRRMVLRKGVLQPDGDAAARAAGHHHA
jgi:putative ABC transport system ATP-binding protein